MRCTASLAVAIFQLVFLFLLSPAANAQDTSSDAAGGSKKSGDWLPPSDFYPVYIADPTRPQNALTLQWLTDTEVPDTGGGRFGLRLGGLLGIYRRHPVGEAERGWQISFEGGFAGQFDMVYNLDNTGWDGFFGLYFDWMASPALGFRVGTQHDSSHVGDEYARRTGRERLDYTREEIVFGVSWRVTPRWRTYGELGYGAGLAGGEPWSVQAGLEYVGAQKHLRGSASRYVAIDVRTYQETDWSTRVTAQAGYRIPVGDRSSVHRIAVELGTGRTVMGQFPWYEETWVGIGWYYDF